MSEQYDVVVVGGGNAGFSAAHAARQAGASVLVLEKGSQQLSGGNTYYTAGAFRLAHQGLKDLLPLLTDDDRQNADRVRLPPYSTAEFAADLERMTLGRCDPDLARILVAESTDACRWLSATGVRFTLLYERQSYEVDGLHRFWGNLSIGVVNEGPGLIASHTDIAREAGIAIRYGSPVTALLQDESSRFCGVVVGGNGGQQEIAAKSIVLAAGGFQADPRLRAAYLGPGWEHAKVRGTPTNTGEVLMYAIAAGAQAAGHWSGCHAVAWDAMAPSTGDREMTNLHTKQSYPIGIVVNSGGKRFIDEGADFRNYTYAKYGAEILRQPGAVAFQLFDAKTEPLLRKGEYTSRQNTRFVADTVAELAQQIGIDAGTLGTTIDDFNAAVQPGVFNPSIRDGKAAIGCDPPKSNWALQIDTPPYLAFPVTCGITFTFGGLRIDAHARVIDRSGEVMRGLYAAGELVGGLFHHNYPGGAGLTAGAVFGRRAGTAAAED